MQGYHAAYCFDQVTTGLDSATSFDVMAAVRAAVDIGHLTVVANLLQPPPQVYALFTDVMLLRDGKVLYWGPREELDVYIETLGLDVPDDENTADFLMVRFPFIKVMLSPPKYYSRGWSPACVSKEIERERERAHCKEIWLDDEP